MKNIESKNIILLLFVPGTVKIFAKSSLPPEKLISNTVKLLQLWEKLLKKHFFNKKPEEMESPREMYERCIRERALKFEKLKGKMKETVKEEEDSHRQTKLAYVDIAPKAPRSIRNQQAKHGTALPSGTPMVAGGPRPRNQILDPTAGASRAYVAPK